MLLPCFDRSIFELLLVTDEFKDGHGGGISLADTRPYYAGISTIPISELLLDVTEQFGYNILALDKGCRLAPGMEISPLGKGDHLVGYATGFLGLGDCGHNSLMLKKRSDHIP